MSGPHQQVFGLEHNAIQKAVYAKHDILAIEYNISNGQLSDVTGSAHVMGRYLANAIVSDKSK